MSSPSHLKTIGLKATLPRLRILELFEKSAVRHLSAEDVYKILLKEGTDTGLATVYRVLTQFEQAGLLVRHHFESGKAVYELNQGGHHDHLVCLQCGRVEEFYDAAIENARSRSPRNAGSRSTSIRCISTPIAPRRIARTRAVRRERRVKKSAGCRAENRSHFLFLVTEFAPQMNNHVSARWSLYPGAAPLRKAFAHRVALR